MMGENVTEKDTLFEWSFALKIFILNIITQKWEGARSYLPPKLDNLHNYRDQRVSKYM